MTQQLTSIQEMENNIPCVDCLVFPMCRQRAIELHKHLIGGALFSVMKNQCIILWKTHNAYKDVRYPNVVVPLSDQKYVHNVLKYYGLWEF